MDDTIAADDLAKTIHALNPDQATNPHAPFVTGAERYREVRIIGRGGMGRVVEAEDRQFGRRVALKTMLGGAAENRFGLEAIVTANLDHPGIPAVYERGRDGVGDPFYAMRMIRGRSLGQALAEARTLDDRLRLLPALIQVAQTLAFAHARGVIHRDIKPENVVVGPFGDTVVIDWGVAKVNRLSLDLSSPSAAEHLADDPSRADATRDGAVVGTPAYMSPEQANGRIAEIDERSDVFSLGALLYHVFTGRPPYGGSSSLAALGRAIAGDHEPLAKLAPDVPPALVAIIERAMKKDPAERYASAGALAEALQELVARGVRNKTSRAVRIFANTTSAVLTIFMLVLAGFILFTVPLSDLGVFAFFLVPTFGLGAVLAAIEWWTLGRYRLSPLVLGLAIVTALEGLVGASVGRTEAAMALTIAHENGATLAELEMFSLRAVPLVELAQTVGLQLCAALVVLYAVARYRISSLRSS